VARSDGEKFAGFARKFKRSYVSSAELAERREIFLSNLRSAEARNALRAWSGDATFGVTPFSDLTEAEFVDRYLAGGYKRDGAPDGDAAVYATADGSPTPRSFDWRNEAGVVTPVKDQGQCGSCWAFAATEEIESARVIAGFPQDVLAPQQIVSCDAKDGGCGGGLPELAYLYVENAGGLAAEADYAYTSGDGETGVCREHVDKVDVGVTGFAYATEPCRDAACDGQDEDALARAVAARGPAVVCVNALAWMTYESGLLTGAQCGSHAFDSLDHCVQVVGYSNYDGDAAACAAADERCAWHVRNSWSDAWGDAGYIKVQMGTNACGIANDATFVDVGDADAGPAPRVGRLAGPPET